MSVNIPKSKAERIIIIGAGFAGITLAQKLAKSNYQIVLIDKNNYHQFQPLFYQVAMAGLEPSSISFPVRKMFQKKKNVHFRMAELLSINTENKSIDTSLGDVNYDYLVIATGVNTNFYGNKDLEKNAYPLKSVSEALQLRNAVLNDYELAVTEEDYNKRQPYVDIVVVGGGPTGVELAGSLAEMKKYILPKDYRELNPDEVDIYLIEGSDRLLNAMSKEASEKALKFLESIGVKVKLNAIVNKFENNVVYTNDGMEVPCRKVIWAAGIIGHKIKGIADDVYVKGNRMQVNEFSQIKGQEHIFALGDIASMATEEYENGHPQMAQGALQQAKNLAKNLKKVEGKEIITSNWSPFQFKNLGSLATIGRNKAVADLPGFKFQGFFAWILWLIVHLKSILGVKNKIFVLFNWMWNYITYDQSLRLIIRPAKFAAASYKEEEVVEKPKAEST